MADQGGACGPNRVLLGLVTFIHESYNKKSMLCKAIYGERHTVENFNGHYSLLIITLCSATLLNIDESKRFKYGAYRFWGCIKYDNAAAKAGGKSDEWIRRRSAEVHRRVAQQCTLLLSKLGNFARHWQHGHTFSLTAWPV